MIVSNQMNVREKDGGTNYTCKFLFEPEELAAGRQVSTQWFVKAII